MPRQPLRELVTDLIASDTLFNDGRCRLAEEFDSWGRCGGTIVLRHRKTGRTVKIMTEEEDAR